MAMHEAVKYIMSFLLSFTLASAFAADFVDMGPLSGSVQGHVWSKVVNEAGQTQGRNEVWSVMLAAPAKPEFVIKCPDSYPLEAVLQWKNEYGEPFEYKFDRVNGGFHKKFGFEFNPKTSKDIRVVVSTRHSNTDQFYQLSLILSGAGSAPPAAVSPGDGRGFLGTWGRSEGGAEVEIMEVTQSPAGLKLVFRDHPGGPVTSQVVGKMEGNTLVAASPRRKLSIKSLGAGRLAYSSSNHDGSSPWSCVFNRK